MFDLDGFCQRECLENFFNICQTPFDQAKMHNLVKSYLVHYAYVETLQAYEDEEMHHIAQIDDDLQIDEADQEFIIESAAKTAAASMALNGNVFPGLSQNQIKQV